MDRLFNEAENAKENGNWLLAEQSCIGLIKLDCLECRDRDIPEFLVTIRRAKPNNYYTKYALGKQAYELGNWLEAIEYWVTLDQDKLGNQFPELPRLLIYAQSELAKANLAGKTKEKVPTSSQNKFTFQRKLSSFFEIFWKFFYRFWIAVFALFWIGVLISLIQK